MNPTSQKLTVEPCSKIESNKQDKEHVVYIVEDLEGCKIKIFFNIEEAQLYLKDCIQRLDNMYNLEILTLKNGDSFPALFEY